MKNIGNTEVTIGKGTISFRSVGSSFKTTAKVLGYDHMNNEISAIYLDKRVHAEDKDISRCGNWIFTGAISTVLKPNTMNHVRQ